MSRRDCKHAEILLDFERNIISKQVIHTTAYSFVFFWSAEVLQAIILSSWPRHHHADLNPKDKVWTSLATWQPAIQKVWHFLSRQVRSLMLTNANQKMPVHTSFGVLVLTSQGSRKPTLNRVPWSLVSCQTFIWRQTIYLGHHKK